MFLISCQSKKKEMHQWKSIVHQSIKTGIDTHSQENFRPQRYRCSQMLWTLQYTLFDIWKLDALLNIAVMFGAFKSMNERLDTPLWLFHPFSTAVLPPLISPRVWLHCSPDSFLRVLCNTQREFVTSFLRFLVILALSGYVRWQSCSGFKMFGMFLWVRGSRTGFLAVFDSW